MVASPREEMLKFVWLEDEVRTVAETLDLSDELIGEMQFASNSKHVLEPLLAVGLERMVKLTFGLTHEDASGSWPGQKIKNYKHGIARLHRACVELILGRLELGTNANIVAVAERELDRDPAAELILKRLQDYAFRDRYYNLTALGGDATEYSPAAEFWAEIDHLSAPKEKHLALQGDHWMQSRQALLRSSLRRVRTFYVQSWTQNLCGPKARQLASTLRGRTPLLYEGEAL